jgi:hypothetical protein
MKKILFSFFLALLSLSTYCQINFEKGYFINNDNQRIECLLKNIDWKQNPKDFIYKLSSDGEEKKALIDDVKEFAIQNVLKYVRQTVEIDRCSKDINKLTRERNPVFNKEVLFLKVLMEGKANLYAFDDGDIVYFYSINSAEINQLVFKNYINKEDNIADNRAYRQELMNNLVSPKLTKNDFSKLNYTEKDLLALFKRFNEDEVDKLILYGDKNKRDLYNLSILAGFNYSSLNIRNNTSPVRNADFGFKSGVRFGVAAELVLPYNKNKWAIVLEPSYQQFKDEASATTTTKVEANIKIINTSVGLRHYLFLNNNSKFYLNGFYSRATKFNSFLKYQPGSSLDITITDNFAFGIGYTKNNKFSLEFRYETDRDILQSYIDFNSRYQNMSLMVGYRLF